MTTVAQDFRTFLAADATLMGLLTAGGETRIFHNNVAQGKAFPQVCFFRRQTLPERAMDETAVSAAMHAFDVECVHTSLSACETLADAVRARCDGFRGTMGGRTVQGIFVDDQDEDYVPRADDSDTVRHVVSFQIEIRP